MQKTPSQRGPLGSALLAAREAMAKTQADLAHSLAVAQATICSWESGDTKPRGDRLGLVARGYGISVRRIRRLWLTQTFGRSAS